jgi:hypothetical protein
VAQKEVCTTENMFEPISQIPLGAIFQWFHLQARNADFIALVFAIISLSSVSLSTSTFFPPPNHRRLRRKPLSTHSYLFDL